MAKFGIGQSVRRLEDPRLLTGGGRYTDDTKLNAPAARMYVLRSPCPCRLMKIDTSADAIRGRAAGPDRPGRQKPISATCPPCAAENRDGIPAARPRAGCGFRPGAPCRRSVALVGRNARSAKCGLLIEALRGTHPVVVTSRPRAGAPLVPTHQTTSCSIAHGDQPRRRASAKPPSGSSCTRNQRIVAPPMEPRGAPASTTPRTTAPLWLSPRACNDPAGRGRLILKSAAQASACARRRGLRFGIRSSYIRISHETDEASRLLNAREVDSLPPEAFLPTPGPDHSLAEMALAGLPLIGSHHDLRGAGRLSQPFHASSPPWPRKILSAPYTTPTGY